MSLAPWREAIQSPRFALLDFWLVVIGGGLLCLLPGLWVWGLLIALIPWGLRIVSGVPPFRRTGFDWWVAGFVVTAGAGYWASYDSSIASVKFLLVIASVLLYYALSSQPQENLVWVSVVLFCVGFGVSVYFLLTHDFLESPRKLEVVNTVGRWVMQFRPSLPWAPIHPNYVAGIAAITTLFIFYPSRRIRSTTSGKFLHLIITAGLGVVLSVMFMATSRGVLMAVVTALGVWILWKILRSDRIKPRLRSDAVFPPLVLALLFAVVIILYLGPATLSGSVSNASRYGGGSRAEVFARSAYLIADFPFTGGGLGAYPGLYSQYILGIPHFYLPNGHNVFLDVFIEQGVPGGLVFLILYVSAIWQAARAVTTLESSGMRLFNWLVLSSLIVAFVHGMVDDYLYNGKGTILSFVPLGLASISPSPKTQDTREPLSLKGLSVALVFILGLGLILMNLSPVRAAWYANIGAVQMARVELAGFPSGKWEELDVLPELAPAETALLSSLEADPVNRTANHRLGLIAMLRRDFPSAVGYLEIAHLRSPGHRGITKALGYCYVWLAQYDKAMVTLGEIPEAAGELDVYVWWWGVQGRSDLSGNASAMHPLLNTDRNAVYP